MSLKSHCGKHGKKTNSNRDRTRNEMTFKDCWRQTENDNLYYTHMQYMITYVLINYF